MDRALIEKLREINNRFYEENAASFSATRKSPWNGWRTVVELLDEEGAFDGLGAREETAREAIRILDVACGNLRFEEFVRDAVAQTSLEFVGIDSTPSLMDGRAEVTFVERDVVRSLAVGETLLGEQEAARTRFDVAVSFGFMHHLPTREMRAFLLEQMLNSVRRGGFVVVSFWQFMNNETLAKKARATHAAALKEFEFSADERSQFDENDFFLGWKDHHKSYRYCHNFSSKEVSELIAGVAGRARVIARFHADGRSGNLNEYVVLKVS